MKSLRDNSADMRVALLCGLYVLFLAVLPSVLTDESLTGLFAEHGPFESLSVVTWLLLSLTILWRIRPFGIRAAAFATVCVFFAAREADLHKAFTADSILKTNYYRHATAPFEEKILAGLTALLLISLLLYTGFIVTRFLFWQGGWRSRAGSWLLIGTALIGTGKVLDRAPAVLLEEYGSTFLISAKLYVMTFEEGLELIHPLILAWSVWISQTERRYLC